MALDFKSKNLFAIKLQPERDLYTFIYRSMDAETHLVLFVPGNFTVPYLQPMGCQIFHIIIIANFN